MNRSMQWVVMGLVCLLAFGCSPYLGNYEYSPRPAVAAVPPANMPATMPTAGQPPPPPAMVVLATIIGVHRADHDLGIPDSVEVRLQVDNNGPDGLVFDPRTLQLITGQLVPFGPVIARPPQPLSIAPDETAYLTAYFPLPPGQPLSDIDMATLQLRWSVQIGGQTVGQGANFNRVWSYYYGSSPYYYGPYWGGPYWGVYPAVGVGVRVHVR